MTYRKSALLVLAALSITSLASSQPPSTQPPSSPIPKPEFEVASIRQNITATEHDRSHIYSATNDGSYRTVNVPLKMLLESAFDFPESRILGVPPSIASAKFDIEAKSDAALSQQLGKLPSDQGRAIKRQMLQALLADRFKLVTHLETRELPIYALVVAKNGPLLHSSKADGTTVNRGNNRISVQGSDNTVALLAEQLSWPWAVSSSTKQDWKADTTSSSNGLRTTHRPPPPAHQTARRSSPLSRSSSASNSNPPKAPCRSWSSTTSRCPRKISTNLCGVLLLLLLITSKNVNLLKSCS